MLSVPGTRFQAVEPHDRDACVTIVGCPLGRWPADRFSGGMPRPMTASMEFVKLYAAVLLLVGGGCAVTGLVPLPVAGIVAIALLAMALHQHRGRSLV
jgi:hypothetical protein